MSLESLCAAWCSSRAEIGCVFKIGSAVAKPTNGSASKTTRSLSYSTSDLEKLQNMPSIKGKKSLISRENTVDPLTMQILRRAGTENTIPQKLRRNSDDEGSRAQATGDGMTVGPTPGDNVRFVETTMQQPKEKKSVLLLQSTACSGT